MEVERTATGTRPRWLQTRPVARFGRCRVKAFGSAGGICKIRKHDGIYCGPGTAGGSGGTHHPFLHWPTSQELFVDGPHGQDATAVQCDRGGHLQCYYHDWQRLTDRLNLEGCYKFQVCRVMLGGSHHHAIPRQRSAFVVCLLPRTSRGVHMCTSLGLLASPRTRSLIKVLQNLVMLDQRQSQSGTTTRPR